MSRIIRTCQCGCGDPRPRRIARRAVRRSGDHVHRRRSAEDAEGCLSSAKWPASAPIRRARSSSTRAPAIRTRRSATTARSRTAARSCSCSIQRQVRPRVGPGCVRLQRRDRPARRSAGQRLDDRRRGQPGREVQSRWQRRARARTQAGDDRRASGLPPAGGGAAAVRRCSCGAAPVHAGAAAVQPARRCRRRRRRRRRPGWPRARIGHSRIGLQPSDRRGVGQGRQHLRRRRHRHQQPRRQVRQGRPVHHALGIDRHGPGPVHRREVDRRLDARATSTSPTPATSASRSSTARASSSRSSATSARR